MNAGIELDSELSDTCYASRLNESLFRSEDRSSHLFKLYNTQYQDWRDGALKAAEQILDQENENVAILSLDFKQCFYCVNTDFNNIRKVLKRKIRDSNQRDFALKLTDILERIHIQYQKSIYHFFSHSHSDIPSNIMPLPIGLPSSSLLCNWHLKEFDENILKVVRPEYYGRYVDDILIVIRNPIIKQNHKILNFMNDYFCKKEIFQYDPIKKIYSIVNDDTLQIQEKKLILHYFLADQSRALLESFRKKIAKNASAFFFLPDDDLQYYVNEKAYNLLFDGSTNKWRNIVGIVENVTELSKNLTNIITGLTQSEIDNTTLKRIADQLFKFYKGKNFVSFCKTWEKIFSFTLLTNQEKEGAIFFFDIQEKSLKLRSLYPKEMIKTRNAN